VWPFFCGIWSERSSFGHPPFLFYELTADIVANYLDNLYDDDDSESGNGWISWFCDLEGHEFFVEVDEEYIRDNFNLHGLREKVQLFK
jgi:hypothetical protein